MIKFAQIFHQHGKDFQIQHIGSGIQHIAGLRGIHAVPRDILPRQLHHFRPLYVVAACLADAARRNGVRHVGVAIPQLAIPCDGAISFAPERKQPVEHRSQVVLYYT